MANPIPPLLCCTPPPIDFIADINDEDDFGDFAVADISSGQFDSISLPVTPKHQATCTNLNINDNNPAYGLSSKGLLSTDAEISKNDELSPLSFDQCLDGNRSLDIEEFQSAKFDETKHDYDDNISSPSSKFELKNIVLDTETLESTYEVQIEDVGSEDEFSAFQTDKLSNSNDNFLIAYKYEEDISNCEENYEPELIEEEIENVEIEINSKKDEENTIEEPDIKPKMNDNLEEKVSKNNSDMEKELIEENTMVLLTSNINNATVFVKSIPKEIEEFNNCSSESIHFITTNNLSQCISEETTIDKISNIERIESCTQNQFNTLGHSSLEEQSKEENNYFEFEADFSQFDSSESFKQLSSPDIVAETMPNPVDLNDFDDDFDDFQDFTSNFKQDDEFGEFNNFEVTPKYVTDVSTTNYGFVNLETINEQLKPILQNMFPITQTPAEKDVDSKAINEYHMFTDMKQIDSADALQYRWSSSNIKNSLIKSLGIDSRNILYGENWNSSMPRFAANMTFSPLEPLKPMKRTDLGNNCSPLTVGIEASDSDKTHVPEVEFDWNTSGLVNPLDASQAHTLLLDLDQLVVVANLDKIKLDSYSCSSPCSSNYVKSTTLAPMSTTTSQYNKCTVRFNDILDGYMTKNENNSTLWIKSYKHDEFNNNTCDGEFSHCLRITNCTANSTTNTINNFLPTNCTNNNANIGIENLTINQYLDCRPKETLYDGKTEAVLTTKSGQFDKSAQQQKTPTKEQRQFIDDAIPPDTIAPATASNIPNFDNDLTTDLDVASSSCNYVENSKKDIYNDIEQSTSVATSTFAGPLKETHIFTPSKPDNVISRSTMDTFDNNKCPIDFDYEMAAAGIIIDETVVKKEYRDVEYNPGFSRSITSETTKAGNNSENIISNDNFEDFQFGNARSTPESTMEDEFSDFQSVCTITSAAGSKQSPTNWPKLKDSESKRSSRNCTPISLCDEMILSPAVLLPQAIHIQSAPKIEWPEPGINPEELARFDEIFAQSKNTKQASPSHLKTKNNTLSISQSIADQHVSSTNDDDDWSEFVSVPVVNNDNLSQAHFPKTTSASVLSGTLKRSPLNDEEWSDFVCSVPAQSSIPQFNSAAWQNANFYNNPLSVYTSTYYHNQLSMASNTGPNQIRGNANNVNYNNNKVNQYLSINNQPHSQYNSNEIHIMQDYSTATMQSSPETTANKTKYSNNKISPSISLIPDMGFVAPQRSSNFINIPKNTFQPKK